jgi:hypothetical protein
METHDLPLYFQGVVMSNAERLLQVRSARAGTAAAKVVALRGGTSTNAGFDGMQLMLDGMRVYLRSRVGYPRLLLVPREGGFGLCLQVAHGPRVWLIAERSKRVRIFRRLETAFAVCRGLEADQVVVLLKASEGAVAGPVVDDPQVN